MDEIMIDRLILAIPGLGPDDAAAVAERVGQGLSAAKAGADGNKPDGEDWGDLTIELNDQAASHGWEQLADAIVNSVLEQVG
ncbi:MAG TPA: hypothetical protein VL986_03935 [Terracidiphilus sp.]|nr:hypothetical protein [Terracidiphilus sp.]